MDQRKRIVRSEESRFVIHQTSVLVRIRRFPDKQLLPHCIAGRTQTSGIVLWGDVFYGGIGRADLER